MREWFIQPLIIKKLPANFGEGNSALEPLRVLHISDQHLFADPEAKLLGVNTLESFSAVLDAIRALPRSSAPHLVVASGDISQDLSSESYQVFCDMLSEFDIPVLCLPGNHDEVKHLQKMAESLPTKLVQNAVTEYQDWSVFLLDSQSDGSVHGYVEPSELEQLERYVQQNPQQSLLLFLHHHPIPMGSEWLDAIGLHNSSELLAIIQKYENIKLCGFGHVHQESSQHIGHTLFSSVPSTCVQFTPASKEFSASTESPGFAIYHCHNKVVSADYHRVTSYTPSVNLDLDGY